MRSQPIFAALSLAALALAGCNASRAPQAAAVAPATRTVTPSSFQLPEGSGCAGVISRYRAVIDNDLAMGHVNRSVADQIQGEISEAASACSAGQDARAVSLVRASKSRHGYPG